MVSCQASLHVCSKNNKTTYYIQQHMKNTECKLQSLSKHLQNISELNVLVIAQPWIHKTWDSGHGGATEQYKN